MKTPAIAHPVKSVTPVALGEPVKNRMLIGGMLMLGSASLFAGLSILIKLLGANYRIWDIGMYRFGGGLILLLLLFGRSQRFFRPDNPRLLITRGITGSIAFICCVTAIRQIPVSTAIVFLYSFPAFAALFSAILYGDRVSVMGCLCVGVALSGVAILFDFRFEGGLVGQAMGVMSGVFAGLTVAIIRKLRETNGSAIIYFYFCLMGTLITFLPFTDNPQLPQTGLETLMIAGIVFTSLVGQLLMNQGFSFVRSWEGGLFMTSELILVAFMGVLFLGEDLTWRFWAGGVLIFGSAVAIGRLGHRKDGEKVVRRSDSSSPTS